LLKSITATNLSIFYGHKTVRLGFNGKPASTVSRGKHNNLKAIVSVLRES